MNIHISERIIPVLKVYLRMRHQRCWMKPRFDPDLFLLCCDLTKIFLFANTARLDVVEEDEDNSSLAVSL